LLDIEERYHIHIGYHISRVAGLMVWNSI